MGLLLSFESQQNALKTGRSPHPTRGKQRSIEEKIKICGGLVNYWKEMSDGRPWYEKEDRGVRTNGGIFSENPCQSVLHQWSSLRFFLTLLLGAGTVYQSREK